MSTFIKIPEYNMTIYSNRNFGGDYSTHVMLNVNGWDYHTEVVWNKGFGIDDLENGESYDSGRVSPALSKAQQELAKRQIHTVLQREKANVLELLNK